jgi:choice-of-anchor C domain-containing protein
MANHVVRIREADLKGALSEVVGAPTAGATLTDSGTIGFSDVDVSDTHTVTVNGFNAGSSNVASALGTFIAMRTSDTTGGTGGLLTWTYQVNAAAIEYLAKGQKRIEAFDVTIDDGHGSLVTRTIVVTITGSNDGPVVISADLAGAVTEFAGKPVTGTMLSDSGTIAFDDVDLSNTHAVRVSEIGDPLGRVTATVTSDTTGSGTGGLVTWTYQVNAAKVEHLAAGEQWIETFDITVRDRNGGLSTQTVSVTITGTNDGVVLANQDVTGTVNETAGAPAAGAQLSDTGQIKFTDADVSDAHTASVVGFNAGASNVASALGAITATITADTVDGKGGVLSWTYTVNAGAVEYLNAGQTRVEAFDVMVDDGRGGAAIKTVVVTIRGSNDVSVNQPPVITSGVQAGAATEIVDDAAGENTITHSQTGTITFTDSNISDTHTASFAAQSGGYLGTFALNPVDQSADSVGWTFSVGDSALDHLKAGQTLIQNYNVTVSDGHGGTASQTVAITITGTNDGATISGASTGAVEEDGTLAIGGTLAVSDADSGESQFQTPASLAGTYGTFAFDATTGAWGYTLDNSSNGVQALANGVTVHDTLTVHSADGTASQVIDVTITGTNDGATIDGTATGAVAEDGTLTAGGTLGVSDPDSGQTQFQTPVSLAGTYGAFSFNASTGEWGYALDNGAASVQALANGQVVHDTFTVHSLDGSTSQVIDVAITGSNDAPTISAVVGGGNLLVNGDFEDSPGNGFYNNYFAASEPNALPGWTITQDGVQLIGEPYWQASEGLNSVQMKVAGVNHFGVLEQSFATTPGTQYDVTFDMTANWADGQTHSIQVSADGQSQGYSANGSGNNNSNMGWSPRSFSFVADDGMATLRIASTDSFLYGAVVDNFAVSGGGGGGTAEGAVTEAADGSASETNNVTHQATGAIAFADIDLADTHTVSVTPADGGYRGTLSASIADDTTGDGSGSIQWTFSASDSDLDDLAAGETLTQTYDVAVDDAQGGTAMQTVTITITGSNDGATIAGMAAATLQEDVGVTSGHLAASGDLTVADADAGEAVFQAQAGTVGSYGTFTLDTSGHWTYTADNSQAAIQGLAVDEHLTDQFTAVSADGTTQTVAITINGTNDVTYVADGSVDPSATKLGAGTQLIVGSGIPANHFGLAKQTDVGVELGLQVIYRQGPVVTTGDTYADDALHFTVNDGAQSALNGSSANNANRAAWNFNYSIATGLNGEPGNLDGYTFKLLYDVDPTAAASYRTLTLEPGGGGSSAHQWRDQGTGLVFIADDAGNAKVTQNSENYAFSFFQSFLTNPYGTANNFDGPAQFDLVLEAHRSGQLLASNRVVVDVVETNDPPTANPDSNGADAVTETGLAAGDSAASGNVLTNDTDPDSGDSKTVTTTGTFTGTYGALTLNANGSWSYALDNNDSDTNALTQGQAVSDVFNYTMRDGEGLTSSSTLTINITGANDGAAIIGSYTGAVSEDGTLTAGGTLGVSDPDSGQNQFQTPASLAGTYGTFAFDATTGEWGYTLDNGAASVQALGNGQVVHDTLTVHSIDGSASQIIDVAITGSNDTPIISAAAGGGNLLVNGGFEDSPGNGFYNNYFATSEPNALPGWTIAQDGVQLIGEPYWQASEGLNSVQMKVAGVNHHGVLEQTFATTPGTQYDVTFDMTANWADGATHSIQVSADGQSQGYSANGSGSNANMGWSPRSFSFVADDSSATLRIESTDSFLYGAVVDNFVVSGEDGGSTVEGAVTEAADGSADEINNVTHQATGAVAFADIDLADTHTVSVTPADGGYRGTLSAGVADDTTGDGAGSIQWTFSASDSELDSLAAGETLTQTYDVTVDDGQGGTATRAVNITITGGNDAPTISAAAGGGNLLVNGSFDQIAGTPGNYAVLAGGSTDITGWTVTGVGIDWLDNTYWEASDGLASLDLSGTIFNGSFVYAGGIEQTFATTPGEQYTVSFDLAGNSYFQAIETVRVSAAGQYQDYSFNTAGHSNGDMGWTGQTFTFTATGGSTTLNFSSLDGPGDYIGPTIDNVHVAVAGSSSAAEGVVTEAMDGSADETNNVTHQATGAIAFADIDLSDTHTVSVAPAGGGAGYRGALAASIADDTTGDGAGSIQWTFSASDSELDDLAAGETVTQTYDVTVDDGQGGTATQTVTISLNGAADAGAAAAVAITSMQGDTGTADDFDTADRSLIVSGTNAALSAGQKVQISTDGTNWADATMALDGVRWQYQDPAVHNAGFTYQARVVDGADNVLATDSRAVSIWANSIGFSDNTGASSTDNITSDHTLVFSGTAVPGAYSLWLDGAQIGGGFSGGSWSFNYNYATLAEGWHFIGIHTGNPTPDASIFFLIDDDNPASAVDIIAITDDTDIAGDYVTSDTTLSLTGLVGGDPYRVQVSSNGGLTWLNATVHDTWWTFDDPTVHNTSFDYTVRAVDLDFNVLSTDTQHVTIQSGTPNQAPVGFADFYSVGEASNFVQTTLSVDAASGVLAAPMMVGDFDPDGGPQPLTAELVSGPSHAAFFEFNDDGSFVYQPEPYYLSYTSDSVVGGTFSTNYSGLAQPDTFVYRAFDGQDYSDPVTVSITVAPPPLLGVNPLGYDMQGSHDPLTEPMGKLYDDLALGGRTFTRGMEIPGGGPPVSDTAAFTVATDDLVFVVSGSGFQYGANDTPTAGMITGLTIRNPAYDPDAPAPNFTPIDLLTMVSAANGPVPAWNIRATDFVQALEDYESNGDRSGLDAIFQSARYSQVGAGPDGHEADVMTGGPFDDYFAGAAGHDTIFGGPGNDFIIPGAEGGTSTGGTGRDWFQFGASDSFNFITDFSGVTGGELDLIDLRAVAVFDEDGLVYSASSFAEVIGQATQVDPTTVELNFSFGQPAPTVITLQNTTVGSLNQSDFLYSTLV